MDAERSLNITQNQFRVGGANFLNVLNAEETYLQAKLDRIQAQAARYTDSSNIVSSFRWRLVEQHSCRGVTLTYQVPL